LVQSVSSKFLLTLIVLPFGLSHVIVGHAEQPEALPNVYSSWPPLYYFPSFCSYRPALSFRDMKIGNWPLNS